MPVQARTASNAFRRVRTDPSPDEDCMTNSFFAGGIACAFMTVMMSAGNGHADDRPLIWSPSKNSDTSYGVRLGLRLPSELQPEAGINLGLDSDKGAVVNTPVRFWGKVTASSIQTPA